MRSRANPFCPYHTVHFVLKVERAYLLKIEDWQNLGVSMTEDLKTQIFFLSLAWGG